MSAYFVGDRRWVVALVLAACVFHAGLLAAEPRMNANECKPKLVGAEKARTGTNGAGDFFDALADSEQPEMAVAALAFFSLASAVTKPFSRLKGSARQKRDRCVPIVDDAPPASVPPSVPAARD